MVEPKLYERAVPVVERGPGMQALTIVIDVIRSWPRRSIGKISKKKQKIIIIKI